MSYVKLIGYYCREVVEGDGGVGRRGGGDVVRAVAGDSRWKGGDYDGDGELRVMVKY